MMSNRTNFPLRDELQRYASERGLAFDIDDYHGVPVVTLSWEGTLSYNTIDLYARDPNRLHVAGSQLPRSKLARTLSRIPMGFENRVVSPIEWAPLKEFLDGLTERLNKTKIGQGPSFPD
jgi:hypothetical protein